MRKSRETLEDWQVADAERLLALWERLGKGRYTQEEFGAQFNIGNQSMVWQYMNGHRALNIESAGKFARGLGCTIAEFSQTLARQILDIASVAGDANG